MREVLRGLAAWRAAELEAGLAAERLGELRGEVEQACVGIAAALGAAGEPSGGASDARGALPALLDEAGRRELAAAARDKDHDALVHELAAFEGEAQRATAELRQALARRDALVASWAALGEELHAPRGMEPGDAAGWLRDLDQLRGDIASLTQLRARLADRGAAADAWRGRVEAGLEALLPGLAGAGPERLVDRAVTDLEVAVLAQQRQAGLEAHAAQLAQRIERESVAAEEAAAVVAAALLAAGVDDIGAYRERCEAVSRALELDRRRAELEEHVATLRGPASADPAAAAAFDALARRPPEVLVGEVARARDALVAAGEALSQAGRARVEAEHALAAIDGSAAAAAARQEVELRRAALGDAVERWFVHRLASRMLTRVLAEPRSDREARVLEATGELFAEITDGRFKGVAPGSEPLDLLAVRADGTTVPTQALSEGTRHQLFLAARLARAVDHNATREPMPLVLDDVFAAFDEARSKAALAVLARVATASQVLVFTHHAHLAGLTLAVEPRARVHRIDASGAVAAEGGSLAGVGVRPG
jgi:uncharacterized protein YhaN